MPKYIMVYSICNNKTDELVILDGTAKECAKMMGMSESSFRSTISKVRSGKVKKWTVKQRYKNISRFGREYIRKKRCVTKQI